MNFEEVKYQINLQEPYFLQEAKKKGYVCPACQNGKGTDGDGITRQNGKTHFHCFKCGLHADVVDLIGKAYNIDNFVEQLKKGCELYGIEEGKTIPEYRKTAQVKQTVQEPEEDLQEYFNKCALNLQNNYNGSYAEKRGISLENVKRFNLGIDENFTESTGGKKWTAFIIPTGKGTFSARNTDSTADTKNRYRKHGEAKTFNIHSLQEATGNVFLVEGEIDALSIIEEGGQAVGIGSASNVQKVLDYIKENDRSIDPALTYTILPDRDEAGDISKNKMYEGLQELNKQVYVANIFGKYKDANEAHVKNPEELKERIEELNVDPAFYSQNTVVKTNDLLQEFLIGIKDSVNTPAIPTGFDDLDDLLDGGLYEDFYILMAGTGHGKTAFILQVADNIAKQGNTVLFYNLEMATYELMSRSISRETFEIADAQGNAGSALNMLSKSARDITDGSRYAKYTEKEKGLIAEAVDKYGDYCDNVIFHEVLGYYDTDKIDKEVQFYAKRDGKAPVIIVDYLQMLSLGITLNSDKKNLTERQAIDKAIYDLKSISRKYKTPVIALSSVNREASKQNKKELSQEAGKESGNIEYTAGTLISLDYASRASGCDEQVEAKKIPREMKLYIHKNRYGRPKQETFLFYNSKCSYFWEDKTSNTRRDKYEANL